MRRASHGFAVTAALTLAVGIAWPSLPFGRADLMAQATPPDPSSDVAALARLARTLDLLRGRNERDYAISSPRGIDRAEYRRIGGMEQWVTVRGKDAANPVVLFLHGGPGDATNPWSYAAFHGWLDRFTVLQWDQRGAGRTLARNGPESASGLTLDRMVEDGGARSCRRIRAQTSASVSGGPRSR